MGKLRLYLIFLILLIFTTLVIGEIQNTKIAGEERTTSSFGSEEDFIFRDVITTTESSNLMYVSHPDGDELNVRFENHGSLTNFDTIVNQQRDQTKYAYQFRLPSNDYAFNVTVYGDDKNIRTKIKLLGKYSAQVGNLVIDFNDFKDFGLESKTFRSGNDIIFQFTGDWNSLGYSVGDLVYLDPTFNYDFGAEGGVIAWQCDDSTSSDARDDFAVLQPLPLCVGLTIVTADTDLDASDNNRVGGNIPVGDEQHWLFQFNITNITTTSTPTNLTFFVESQLSGTPEDTGMLLFNYGNSSWVQCDNYTIHTLSSDLIHACSITEDITDYFNSTGHVSGGILASNSVGASITTSVIDYVYLEVQSIIGNNTWYESTGSGLGSQKYLNVTFRYETNNSVTDGALDGTFITNPIGITTTNTTSIIHTDENPLYEFSFEPPHLNITNSMTLIYNNHGSQTRTFSDTLLLTNGSIVNDTITLYLLPSTDGIFTTFQVFDTAERPIDNVLIIANRSISGINTEVQRGTTGSAGTISFFLNPDIVHTFVLSKTGFNTLTTDFAPTQSLYTFTLGSIGGISTNQTNYFEGIKYSITPSRDNLVNGTFYNFSFFVDSNFFPLNRVGYRLFNGTGHFLFNNTCTGAVGGGCNISTDTQVNIGLNQTIIMNAFWDVDGNLTNVTRFWNVFEVSQIAGNSSFDSLRHDFTNLFNAFGTGRNAEFTKGIISFLIILFGTAGLAFRSGQFSPIAILIYMFGLVAFLDLLNFLPTPVGELFKINGITILVGVLVIMAIIADQRTN